MFVLLYISCSEPFLLDAHDLSEPRIAALSLTDGLMIWSGEGRYHNHSPMISWTDQSGDLIGEGYYFEPPLEQELGLNVVFQDGQELNALVWFQEDFELPDVTLSFYPFDENTLDRERRLLVEAEPLNGAALEPEMSLRIELDTDLSTRWMAPHPSGEILELTKNATDVVPRTLIFEDGEVIDSTIASIEGVLSLVMDKMGGNRWFWIDPPSDNSILLNGRYIPVDSIPEMADGERWTAIIRAQSTVIGFSFEEWLPLSEVEVEYPECFGAEEALRMSWVEGGRCSLNSLLDARVEVHR